MAKSYGVDELERIIKTCASNGVIELKLGSIALRFSGELAIPASKKPVQSTSEGDKPEEDSVKIDDTDYLNDLMVNDPERYEELLLQAKREK